VAVGLLLMSVLGGVKGHGLQSGDKFCFSLDMPFFHHANRSESWGAPAAVNGEKF
jgi:hypothetical protein